MEIEHKCEHKCLSCNKLIYEEKSFCIWCFNKIIPRLKESDLNE